MDKVGEATGHTIQALSHGQMFRDIIPVCRRKPQNFQEVLRKKGK